MAEMCDNNYYQLEKVQNQALRIITGGMRTTPIPALRMETGIMSLKGRIQQLAIKYILKISDEVNHPNQKVIQLHTSEAWKFIPWNYAKPLVPAVANIISKLGINEDLIQIRLESPEINFKDVIINKDTYPVCKKEDSLQVKRNCFLNTLSEKYPSFQQYYTDGSKIGEKVGYSVLSKETGKTITGRLEEGVSVFDAEMTAIEKALRIIHGECPQNSKAVVLSDSRSAIAAIKGNSHKSVMGIYDKLNKCQEKAITVGLQWCPSHCDIDGNEKADKLAKEATLLGSISSECTNFYSKYRRITWLLKKSEINRNLEKSSNRYVEYFKGKTPNKKYIPIIRKAANIIFRLRTQHAATKEHLKKIKFK